MTMASAQQDAARRTTGSLRSGHLPRLSELWFLLGAAAVSAAVLALFGFNVTGWLCLTAAIYLVVVGVVSRLAEGHRQAINRVMRGLVVVAFLLALIPLVSALWTVIANGAATLTPDFIFGTEHSTFDRETFETKTVGGVWPAVVGTLVITGIAAVISIPIGLLTAIWLTEYALPSNPVRRIVTFLVDGMTGIPSIVAGLFAFSLFTLIEGPGAFSGISAAVALCVLMIPTMVRSSEEMLRLVPLELREAAFALGVTRWRTIVQVVLRTAIAGLVTGAVLAIARVIGETAPIYIAAGYTSQLNVNPGEGAMSTLAVVSYNGYAFPDPSQPDLSHAEAWSSALLLIIIVVILNLIARVIATVFAPRTRR